MAVHSQYLRRHTLLNKLAARRRFYTVGQSVKMGTGARATVAGIGDIVINACVDGFTSVGDRYLRDAISGHV